MERDLALYLDRHSLGRTADRTAGHSHHCTVLANTRRIALDSDSHVHFELAPVFASGHSTLVEELHMWRSGRMPSRARRGGTRAAIVREILGASTTTNGRV